MVFINALLFLLAIIGVAVLIVGVFVLPGILFNALEKKWNTKVATIGTISVYFVLLYAFVVVVLVTSGTGGAS